MKKTCSLILIGLLISCHHPKCDVEQVMKTDRNFSSLSAAEGVNKAFTAYADDSVVLLRKNSYPIIGLERLKQIFSRPDTSFSLTWEPSFGYIAESNDLGYTYGIYTLTTNDTTEYGTYVTIWKNTSKGWKYVLDTGNDGLGKFKK